MIESISPSSRPPDPYIPGRIRAGARPSGANCYGCLDLVVATSRIGRRHKICQIMGKGPQYSRTCPKLQEGP